MPKETTNKKQSKDKKHFMKDFKAELKRVIWPTPKQLVNNTVAVITIVLITAAIVFALDFTFEKMNEYGIEGIKSLVNTNSVVDENVENSTENNNEVSNDVTENSEASNNTVNN